MLSRVNYPANRLPSVSADPAAAAGVTRSALGLSPDRPIPHLIHAIEKSGGVVLAIPTALERRDAFCTWWATKPGHDFLGRLQDTLP
jgi:hypothetical protein